MNEQETTAEQSAPSADKSTPIKKIDPKDFINRSCKHCYGTGVYAKTRHKNKDGIDELVSIPCPCIRKGMQRHMEKQMADGTMPFGPMGKLGMMGRKPTPEMMQKIAEARLKAQTPKETSDETQAK